MSSTSILRTMLACLGLLTTTAYGGLVASDVPYGTAHPNQLFDWYAPDVPTVGPTPVAIYFHGGMAGSGSKADVNVASPSVVKNYLLRNGFTVLAINFHPYPEFVYPTQIQDAATAVQYFRANAATLGIDPQRMTVWGTSGGAIIGGLLCYGVDFQKPNGTALEQQSSRPQALLNFVGLTNFHLMVSWYPGTFFNKPTLAQVDAATLDAASMSIAVGAIPRPFTPPVASFYNNEAHPAPLVDPHDPTMMKDLHSKLTASFPSVAAKSLQILKFGGGDGAEGFEHISEWALHRMGVDHALDLGKGLPNSNGKAPEFKIDGTFAAGSSYTVHLRATQAAVTTLYVVIGNARIDLPFAGGTLVPNIGIVVPLVTDATGEYTLPGILPPDVPLDTRTYLQAIEIDPFGPKGYSLSSGLRVTTGI